MMIIINVHRKDVCCFEFQLHRVHPVGSVFTVITCIMYTKQGLS